MSASTPRGDLLLRDGDPKPFVLIEFSEPPEGEESPGTAVSWGDQIPDDEVEVALIFVLATMRGIDPDLLGRVFEALAGDS